MNFRRFLHKEGRVAFGAFFGYGFIPGGEFTIGVVATPIEEAASAASFSEIAVAIGFRAVNTDADGFGVLAFGIARTRKESAAFPASLYNDRFAAFVTDFIGWLRFRNWFISVVVRFDVLALWVAGAT